MRKSSWGLAAVGGAGFSEGYSGPATALSYSFNGKAEIGVSYTSLSKQGDDITNVSLSSNFLLYKQYSGDPLNFELSQSIQRSMSLVDMTTFSLGIGISRDLVNQNELQLIPRINLTYSNYIVDRNQPVFVKNDNTLIGGVDLNIGIELAENVKFIFIPGISYNFRGKNTAGALAGGILVY